MAKKKKKHSGSKDIALSYRIESLPRRVKKSTFYKTLLRYIRTGEPLPEGWEVTLRWRNSKKQAWREAEFMEAISDSREGFNSLVARRLRRDRDKLA